MTYTLRMLYRKRVSAALRYLASSVRGLTELELLDLLSCFEKIESTRRTDRRTDEVQHLVRLPGKGCVINSCKDISVLCELNEVVYMSDKGEPAVR